MPPLPTSARPTSNCGLISITISPCGFSRAGTRRHDQGDGYETDIAYCDIAELADVGMRQIARVGLIFYDNARIGPNSPIELCGADVDRVDAHGSALQETVGEPSGGRSDIEATLPETSMLNCVSAASSFKPPRLTKGKPPRISTDASDGTV